jgi:hypothetical protein
MNPEIVKEMETFVLKGLRGELTSDKEVEILPEVISLLNAIVFSQQSPI